MQSPAIQSPTPFVGLQPTKRDGALLRAVTAGRLMLVALGALLGTGSGCRAPDPRPAVNVRLGGAQIPVELVASWISDAEDDRFVTEQVGPVYLSQHGFENLLAERCDVACTDRQITSREYARFEGRTLEGYRVGFYGYALYVNPANPLDSIFAGHLEPLYQRKITDWKELGPYEGPIRLVGPRKSTRGGMILMRQARVWFDDPTWETFDSDADIVEQVAADPLALGFASIGLDQGVRYLGLRMQRSGPPAFPSLEEIESERYGLAKVIYVYMPASAAPGEALVEYLMSADGGRAMESTGVWPILRDHCHVELP